MLPLKLRSGFLGLPLLLGVGVSVMLACSGGSTTTGVSSVPESHAAVQTNGACTTKTDVLRGTAGVGVACQTYADCAPVCCACSQSTESFSAAACVEGVCASRDTTCSVSKKVDYCPSDPAPTDGGPSADGPDHLVDGAPPPPSSTTMCIAFTGSHAQDREAARLATLQQLITQVTTSPGGGTLNVVRDSANRPTSVTFSASGSAEDYRVTITYDATGNVTQFHRTWSGATQTDTHAFTYDSQSHLTSARVTWSGSMPTETQSLTYDSSHRLSTWRQTWSDAQPTENEKLTYDSDGFLATWRRSWSDAQPTETETFTYDSSKRLTSWRRSWSDATQTETATFTYSGNARMPGSSNLSGPIPMGSHVVDCK